MPVAHAGETNTAAATSNATSNATIPTVEYGAYQGTSFGAYLAPLASETRDFIDADGGVDLVFHFNAALLAEKSWRRSDANAVIVSQAFSTFGSGPYEDAYADHIHHAMWLGQRLALDGSVLKRTV